jgi:hypothetical protein
LGSNTLSITDFQSSRVAFWNIIPISGRGASIGVPKTDIRPVVGFKRPATIRSRVDLPQPDGPMSDTNSPLRIWKLASCRAVTGPGNSIPTNCPATTTGRESAAPRRSCILAVAIIGASFAQDFRVRPTQSATSGR